MEGGLFHLWNSAGEGLTYCHMPTIIIVIFKTTCFNYINTCTIIPKSEGSITIIMSN